MREFSKSLVVSEDDLDEQQHVNNVRYVQWIQDISKEHWEKAAPPEIQGQVLWVVRTHHITYKNPALLGDTLLLKTHIASNRGPLSVRQVDIYLQKTQTLLVRAQTEWCMLGAKSGKPQRIESEIVQIFK